MEYRVVSFKNRGNLSVVQLATADQNTFEYISSAAAIEQGAISVKEISEGGSVNNLHVLNESDKFVFFMDGDVLEGAKQNRVLNASMLIDPMSGHVVPVSCVEQGRWRRTSQVFSSGGFVAPAVMRASKAARVRESLRQRQGHYADQHEVWRGVALFAGVHSVPSSNLSDLFHSRRSLFEETIADFSPEHGANGLGVFIGKELKSVDLFNRSDVFAEYLPKLLRGIVVESSIRKNETEGIPEAEGTFRVLDMLDKAAAAESETFPGGGVGEERRFAIDEYSGFDLMYESKRIHTALLKNAEKGS